MSGENRSVRRSRWLELSTAEFPLASSALQELLAEPFPRDALDELWVSLVVGLAHEQLEDALGEGTAAWADPRC